jgi:hypothetical protein
MRGLLQRRLAQEIVTIGRTHADVLDLGVARERQRHLDTRGTDSPGLAQEIGEPRRARAVYLEHHVSVTGDQQPYVDAYRVSFDAYIGAQHKGRINIDLATGEITFERNFRISDSAFPEAFGQDGVVNSSYMGDYDTADADNGNFYYTWGDNRDLNTTGTRNQADIRFAHER